MGRGFGVLLAVMVALPVSGQMAMPAAGATHFKDTSAFRPPAGAKVAIVEFEDLECPLCGHVSPMVRAAMAKYGIPRVHHDFLIPSHAWSRAGAIYARYLEDKVGTPVAEQFRADVFANQRTIASEEDLEQYARRWFQAHGQGMPFVIDPTGRCAKEVQADCDLGLKVGVAHTPTIVVATAKEWIEVTDPDQLYAAIDRAEAPLRGVTPSGGAPDGRKRNFVPTIGRAARSFHRTKYGRPGVRAPVRQDLSLESGEASAD
jgi:protein-disulfide isomerase